MWRFAFLGLAFLGLTVSCTDGPGAPSVKTDGLSLQEEGDPPPPPVDGDVIFTFRGGFFTSAVASSSRQQDCPVEAVFCVPARFFQTTDHRTEWLDYLPVGPLPSDIKRQLKERGAVCAIDPVTGMDVICDVNSSAQGRLFEKNLIGDGKGLAYDVTDDGMSVVTIALDQFDNSTNPLSCFGGADFAHCNTLTRPVIAESWVGVADENGNITYTRGEAAPGVFVFVGGDNPYCRYGDPFCVPYGID